MWATCLTIDFQMNFRTQLNLNDARVSQRANRLSTCEPSDSDTHRRKRSSRHTLSTTHARHVCASRIVKRSSNIIRHVKHLDNGCATLLALYVFHHFLYGFHAALECQVAIGSDLSI